MNQKSQSKFEGIGEAYPRVELWHDIKIILKYFEHRVVQKAEFFIINIICEKCNEDRLNFLSLEEDFEEWNRWQLKCCCFHQIRCLEEAG